MATIEQEVRAVPQLFVAAGHRAAGTRLDLRPRRDLWSRRRLRDAGRSVARTSALMSGDGIAAAIALYATAAITTEVEFIVELPWVVALLVLGQAALGTYGGGRLNSRRGRVAVGVVAVVLLVQLLGELTTRIDIPEVSYLAFTVIAVCAILAWRTGFALAVAEAYRRGLGVQNLLVVGGGEEARSVQDHYRRSERLGVRVIGHLAPDLDADPTALGGLDRLGDIVERYNVSNVTISANLPAPELKDLIRACFMHGTAVGIVPGILNTFPCRVSGSDVLGWPLLHLEAPHLHILQVVMKRTLDVAVAGFSLLVLSPLFLCLALAIKLDSRGPVIFRQRRPGAGGKPFVMYKFRSMRMDAEHMLRADAALYARYLANDCKLPENEDPRISRLGAFLRRTSLDELPQLFNVFRGDMSLVGPRPVLPEQIDEYGSQALTFLGVKPGITGYWQISGRSNIRYPERAELDIQYVTSWSIGLDLKILFLTVPAVLQRRGAH